jgi:hypothetical protein
MSGIVRDTFRGAAFTGNAASARNIGLDERRKLRQRLLPAQITHFKRDGLGDAALRNAQLGSTHDWLQGDRHLEHAWQVRILELVRGPKALAWNQLKVLTAERGKRPARAVLTN